jgi:putative redox protein
MSEEKPTNLWKEISASWDGASGYLARTPAGAEMLMGKDPEGKPGIGPMEALLVGLAGCTMIDIVDIMRKKRQVPVAFEVKVRGNQRLTEYPYRFTGYEVQYLLWGDELQEKDVAQAIQLSEEKYCSVGGTLALSGPIHSTFRILKPGESAT